MTDQNSALIVGIARIIDHPSVYMGGPSRNSLRIAKMIVKEFGADLARADRAAPEGQPVTLTYTNWRGETAERTITPKRIWFGSTDWHPEPQWLLTAFDAEKQADRDFALKDFGQAPPPAAQEPVARIHEHFMKNDHHSPPACQQEAVIEEMGGGDVIALIEPDQWDVEPQLAYARGWNAALRALKGGER